MEKRLLEILACPVCKGKLVYDAKRQVLICRFDRLAFPLEDRIPILLASAAQAVPEEQLPS